MRGDRVYGPYKDRRGWRVVYVEEGERASTTCSSQEDAEELAADLRRQLQRREVTVGDAIDEWLDDLERRGRQPTTTETIGHRLRAVLTDEDEPLQDITPIRARQLVERYLVTPRERGGEPPAAETARSTLARCRRFARWAMRQRYLTRDPFPASDELELEGPRRRSRAQLTIDEARRLTETAVAEAEAGSEPEAGVGVLMALLLGLRASEVTGRRVRDLDDDGRILWITASKTEAGRRHVHVPEVLRALLAGIAQGRAGDEPLLGARSRWWLEKRAKKLCARAGVTIVSPHGLRRTHVTLAREAGATGPTVAAAVGHADGGRTAERHYQAPGTTERARQRVALTVIEGGE